LPKATQENAERLVGIIPQATAKKVEKLSKKLLTNPLLSLIIINVKRTTPLTE
jgi:hypothetical protein